MDHNKWNLLEVDDITNKTDKHRPGALIINLGTTRALVCMLRFEYIPNEIGLSVVEPWELMLVPLS